MSVIYPLNNVTFFIGHYDYIYIHPVTELYEPLLYKILISSDKGIFNIIKGCDIVQSLLHYNETLIIDKFRSMKITHHSFIGLVHHSAVYNSVTYKNRGYTCDKNDEEKSEN